MLQRALAFTVALITAGIWVSSETPVAQSAPGRSPWLRTESQHFEIHYLPTLARDVERMVGSAERAYHHISGRLDFVFPKKVPLVMSATTGPLTRDEIVAYAVSDEVAPQQPHRSRLVLPVPERDADLDALIVHELTHLLFCEIILPEQSGDGGLPRWVHEGIANYMVGTWSDAHERLLRNLAASGNVLNALIVPRVDKTYNAVFELTPAEFDGAFRNYVERRCKPVHHQGDRTNST